MNRDDYATTVEKEETLDDIIRPAQLPAKTGLSRATIYRMMNRGDFPLPIVLSPGAVGWPENVIRKWRSDRATASDAGDVKARGKREKKS